MNTYKWWKDAIAYQIYPRSFKDTNKDGIGDLRGITQKLDYLKNLGIDVIWICPMYKSPNDDNGYDISDYQDIMEDFGTMQDFDALLHAVHEKGMKLIIDLVINHTSDEHDWFIESRSSKENPKRDWYIWREGHDNKEPNNWESIFKGSAWEKNDATSDYFLHLFSKRQPDLNWENEEVRKNLYQMINWWLEKGIDGFRVDAISHIKKEDGLTDMENPEGLPYVSCFPKMMNISGIESYLHELKTETFSKYDIMTVGEANGVNPEDSDLWVGEQNGAFNMIFQFNHLELWNAGLESEFDVLHYKNAMQKWQDALYQKGWNALFIENHDQPRVVSKWGNDTTYWCESAKSLALSYFMQQGTPFIYQGQEIGMSNTSFDSIESFNDVSSINTYQKDLSEGLSPETALKKAAITSRDNSRTPMQWDATPFAGFTDGDSSWLKANPNYTTINVASQLDDSNSILTFYKKMIRIRKSNDVFRDAPCHLLMPEDDSIYAYIRYTEKESFIILCNLSDTESMYSDNRYTLDFHKLLLATHTVEKHTSTTTLTLKPWESRLYKL